MGSFRRPGACRHAVIWVSCGPDGPEVPPTNGDAGCAGFRSDCQAALHGACSSEVIIDLRAGGVPSFGNGQAVSHRLELRFGFWRHRRVAGPECPGSCRVKTAVALRRSQPIHRMPKSGSYCRPTPYSFKPGQWNSGWLGSVRGPRCDGLGTGVRERTPATRGRLLFR